MARRRTTFGKLQRDRDKQAKQQAKLEKRLERSRQGPTDEEDTESEPEVDQDAVLAQLAQLHADYDDGKMSLDVFEERRAELTSQLRVD